jgi:hypothetical protein
MTVHMRRSLRAVWGRLMLACFVAAAMDSARAQGVAASPVAPAPSQVGHTARSSGSAPSLSGNAPVSKVPEHDAESFAVVQAPAPVSFLNLLEARYARLPRRTALHYDGWLVAVLHPMNGKRHQDPEFLD